MELYAMPLLVIFPSFCLSGFLIINLLSMMKGREGTRLLSSRRSGPHSLGQYPTNLPLPFNQSDILTENKFQSNCQADFKQTLTLQCTYTLIHPGITVQSLHLHKYTCHNRLHVVVSYQLMRNTAQIDLLL